MRLRRGHLLVEAICALALAGLLAAVAVATLSTVRGALHAAERRDRAVRAESDAVAILREAIEASDALVTRGDTAIDLDLLLGAAVVCGTETRALWFPPATSEHALTQLPTALATDDLVAVRLDGDDDSWWHGTVDSVQTVTAAGACDVAEGWRVADQPRLRVVLRDTVPAEIVLGAAVRLARRARFTLYHAGSGDWMLGYRKCHPWLDVCGVVQPLAGPLRTPAAGGLRLVVEGSPSRLVVRARGADGGAGAEAVLVW